MGVENFSGGAFLSRPALDPLIARAHSIRALMMRKRQDRAENIGRKLGCDVHGCKKIPARFVGSRRVGWLHFCTEHRDIAYAVNTYFHNHNIR